MHIRILVPRNYAELAEVVPIVWLSDILVLMAPWAKSLCWRFLSGFWFESLSTSITVENHVTSKQQQWRIPLKDVDSGKTLFDISVNTDQICIRLEADTPENDSNIPKHM